MGIELLLDMAAGATERVLLGSAFDGLRATDLAALSDAGARDVARRGVKSIAFVGLNGPILPLVLFAAAKAGVPATPLNYRLSTTALRQLLDRLPRPLVIVDEEFLPAVEGVPDVIRTADWLQRCSEPGTTASSSPVPADDTDVAVSLFTSGTTAEPKSVLLRHEHLTSYIFHTVEFDSAEASETTLVSMPPYHVAAVGSVLSNLFSGRRVVYLPNFAPETWVDLVEAEAVTSVMLVPTMLTRIVDLLESQPRALPSLRRIAYGGAKMPRPTLERAMAIFSEVDFTNAYGLTETSSTISILGPEDHRRAFQAKEPRTRALLSSAGRFVPGMEGQVRAEAGEVVGPGKRGELWVRGAQVSGEYAGSGSVLDPEGWFPTRDVAEIDEDGYLFIHGRADDTIIRGGENIAPGEIEDVLMQHTAVLDVGVLGVPDPEWGQRIRAVVVLEPGADETTPDSLRAWVRERLRGSRTPDEVLVVEALPYSPTGKLLRTQLQPELLS